MHTLLFQVRIMKKRLVRKTFDMIEDIADRENKEVRHPRMLFCLCSLTTAKSDDLFKKVDELSEFCFISGVEN